MGDRRSNPEPKITSIKINVSPDDRQTSTVDRTRIRFSVTDTGVGIADSAQVDLFEPFVQADASSTRQYGGTGLGLTISRRIVELMGGEIGVDSQLGEGASFWFVVPLGGQYDSENNPKTTTASMVPDSAVPDSAVPDSAMTDSTERQAINPANVNILVAEDNPDNQDVVVMMLEGLDYTQVETASNGLEVLEKAALKHYDLILMDCQMPQMDGYEATRKLRESDDENKTTTVIAMTANAMQGDREQCLAAGMDDYLSKPLMLDKLADVLEKWSAH